MACPSLYHCCRNVLRDCSHKTHDIPLFLVPSVHRQSKVGLRRDFSSSTCNSSRIGIAPVSIPPDVSIRLFDLPKSNSRSRKIDTPASGIEITGPLGSLTLSLPPYIVTKHDEEAKKVSIRVADSTIAHQRAMWGTMRAHLQNSISGVSEGHVAILRLVGVGYRASIESRAQTKSPTYEGQQFVNLKLGFAHPVEMAVPMGVKATVPQPTRILLEGCDKHTVTKFAAEIREWRKPEPYKGKGIFVNDETIRLKAKKIK